MQFELGRGQAETGPLRRSSQIAQDRRGDVDFCDFFAIVADKELGEVVVGAGDVLAGNELVGCFQLVNQPELHQHIEHTVS